MDSMQFIGYVVTSIITLAAFVGIIMKFVQPINDLRVVIQKLNDNLDSLKTDTSEHSRKIEKHDEQISNLDHRVGTIETKIEIYHEEGPS